MLQIHRSQIDIRKRQRTSIETAPLNDLKEKILATGLLHAPVCWYDEETSRWVLTVGERRYRAMCLLHDEKKTFIHDGTEVASDHIPITRLADFLDEIGRFEAELNENVVREDLSWQDRVKAFAALHEMREARNPNQRPSETAREVIASGAVPNTSARHVERRIVEATVIAKHLDNEKIANARNPQEAYALVLKGEEEKLRAALARRNIASMSEKPTVEIRNGNALTILPQLDSGFVDLLLFDPPYGLGASSGGFRQRTVHHHNYQDTPEVAREIARCALIEGFRVSKARANFVMFCDIAMFDWIKTAASNAGWEPFRRPLIWQKSESEGLAPWGGQGPRITTEFIFYATKGRLGMYASPTDVFNVKRVPRQERLHAAEKPVELLAKLITCCTMPGDMVLDLCCGSGSTLVACKDTKRRGLGIEKDPDYYNTAMANVFGKAEADA